MKFLLTNICAIWVILTSLFLTMNAQTVTIKVELQSIQIPHKTVLRSPSIYGFVGVQVFKVTNAKTESLKSFGNKPQYFFDRTEDRAFPYNGDVIVVLGNKPDYIREFQIPLADWNNPNVKYEIRIWHHLKGKITGPNYDFSKHSETFDLKQVLANNSNKIINVGKGFSFKSTKSSTAYSFVTTSITKL